MTRVLAVWVTGLAAGALVLITLALLRTLAPVSGRRRVACLLCPTSQILVTWFVHVAVYEGRIDELASLAVAACTAGCTVLCAALLRALVAAEGAEAVAEEVRVMEDVLAAQRDQARSLARARDSASALRERAVQTLDGVAEALEGGRDEWALELLGVGERSLRAPERTACAQPAVAALLAAKAERCAELGMRWDCRVDLPARLDVSSVALCMVFSNLLDNAVAGAQASGAPEPFVRVRAHVAHGLLAVRVENSCAPGSTSAAPRPVAGSLPEHGWGQRIVASVVASHDGDFRFGEKDGVWRADAILQLGEGQDEA